MSLKYFSFEEQVTTYNRHGVWKTNEKLISWLDEEFFPRILRTAKRDFASQQEKSSIITFEYPPQLTFEQQVALSKTLRPMIIDRAKESGLIVLSMPMRGIHDPRPYIDSREIEPVPLGDNYVLLEPTQTIEITEDMEGYDLRGVIQVNTHHTVQLERVGATGYLAHIPSYHDTFTESDN